MPDDDYQPQTYQDDLTTDDNVSDPVMREETDDPTENLQVPADKLRDEMNKEFDDED